MMMNLVTMSRTEHVTWFLSYFPFSKREKKTLTPDLPSNKTVLFQFFYKSEEMSFP